MNENAKDYIARTNWEYRDSPKADLRREGSELMRTLKRRTNSKGVVLSKDETVLLFCYVQHIASDRYLAKKKLWEKGVKKP